MNIRIYNAKILTMSDYPDMTIIDGEIIIEGNKIKKIGTKEPSPVPFDREIDAHGNLVMPGFKNAHSHSPMAFARSFADDLPLDRWLNEKIFPLEGKLTDSDINLFTKISLLEYISGGITATFDMYFRPENIVEAALEFGFREVICGAVNDFVESVARMESFYDLYNKRNSFSDNRSGSHSDSASLISYKLGFHAEYTTNESLLKDIAALAHDKNAPVYCHNSETKSEVAGCIARHGATPVAYLDSLGMFDYGGGGFHMIYTDNNDLDIIRKRGIHVVSCPASNGKLASGMIPMYKYLADKGGESVGTVPSDSFFAHPNGIPNLQTQRISHSEPSPLTHGINIALGTDGPASNNALSMFREMYLTSIYQKLYTENAAAMDADRVLYMATVGGAKAMGLTDCDTLSEGKYADLIMIDLNTPNMQPVNNITKNLVYSGDTSNVIMTMINGNILYERGEFYIGGKSYDTQKLYSEANKRMEHLK